MVERVNRILFLICALFWFTLGAGAQSSGLYWFGSIANSGTGMLTTDGRIVYIGSGYNGPYNYFVTMDESAQVQAFTTHALVGRTGSAAGSLLTRDGQLLRGLNTMRPGTNIPELVLCLTDAEHNVLWTRTYAIPDYQGSRSESLFGWTYNDGFMIQVTFRDSLSTASARIQGLMHLDGNGDVISTRVGADLISQKTLDTLPGGDLLFGTATRLTRVDEQWNALWSKSYTSSATLHPVNAPVAVGAAGEIRLLWNMGDTTFQFPAGGAATWPAYSGLLAIDPASGAILGSRRFDMNKPFKLHGITGMSTGDFMLFGSYNTLRPYTPSYMRVHGLLERITPSGQLLSVDTFYYSPQLKSSEILSLAEFDGRMVMSINLHDGTNPGRYLATTDADGQFPCELYPATAISTGTVNATVSDETLWQLTDVNVVVTDLESVLSPSSVNIVRVCGSIPTDLTSVQAPLQRVWPNPASDRITIAMLGSFSTTDRVELVNSAGEMIAVQGRRSDQGLELDLRDIAPGIYALRLREGPAVRFVKE